MTETADLAVRTRKARHSSACVLCPAIITTGERIGLIRRGWAHVACIVTDTASERAQLRVLMTTPPQPSERLGTDHLDNTEQPA